MLDNNSTQVAVTVVFGEHIEKLDLTFTSFLLNQHLELHAFILGDKLPNNIVPRITYHLKDFDSTYSNPIRDADFRRWEFIDELKADYAIVVDGLDVLCLQPIPELPNLLRGAAVGACMEHPSGRYLDGKIYCGNFLNAGVTIWNIQKSRQIRNDIIRHGRVRYRNNVDDQLSLNEVIYAKYLDELIILPCVYNYRAYYRRHKWGWPTCQNFDGVRIYHHDEWRKAKCCVPVKAHPPMVKLKPDRGPIGNWKQLLRRLSQRLKPHRIR